MSKHTNEKPEDGFGAGEGKDYEVGYGKPPKHGQFQEGNKMGKGRKPGSKGLKTIVTKAFGKKVAVKEGSKTCKKTKTEVGIEQLANKFAKGDPKATDKSLQLLERYGPQDDLEGPSPERVEANLSALVAYAAMKRQIDGMEEGDGD